MHRTRPGRRLCIVPVLFGAAALALVPTALPAEPIDPLWSIEELLARFPPREANAAALEIERRTAKLGIDIATRPDGGRDRPGPAASDAHQRIRAELGNYLQHQLQRPGAGIERPPAAVEAYLAERGTALSAVRRQLVRGETPRWELRLDRLADTPLPNLLGHIDLHKLLLVDALGRAAAGDMEGALADLEASWRLGAALRDDPILINQLVAVAVARLQAGTLRHLEGVPVLWRDRLYEHDFRGSVTNALRLEGWLWSQVDAGVWLEGPSRWRRYLFAAFKPYVRMCVTDTSAEWARRVENLSRLEYLCDRDLANDYADLSLSIPWWNLVGDFFVPDGAGVVARLASLELDLELTSKVLELKAARDRLPWPSPPLRIEESVACPRDRWVHGTTPEGHFSISFARPIEWPIGAGTILPTRYTSASP